MVRNRDRGVWPLFFAFVLGFIVSTSANAASFSQTTKLLGRNLGAETSTGAQDDANRFSSFTDLKILGKVFQAVGAFIDVPESADVPATIEFYSFSRRVFSDTFYFSHSGVTGARVGLAPAEVRVPLVVYPVGPVVLGVDGGVRFQAALEANLYPTFVIPFENTIIGLKFDGSASGAGFIEGAAKLLVVRAGVGGQVDLVDTQATARGDFFFDGRKPTVRVSAWAEFLRGKLFAFADYLQVWKFKWKRFWDYSLFEWNGICVSTSEITCKRN